MALGWELEILVACDSILALLGSELTLSNYAHLRFSEGANFLINFHLLSPG